MKLDGLVRICQEFGKDMLLVQAGGGNVSVKTRDRLAVKASGIRLGKVSARRGIARADQKKLLAGMAVLGKVPAGTPRELAYVKLLGDAGTGKWRVSMEAGFHAAIPHTYVAHHHSLAGILLGMESDAVLKRLIKKEFGSAVSLALLPAAVPGANLSLDLRRIAMRLPRKKPLLAILRNHGLVWAADSSGKVLALSRKFERAFRRRYGIEAFPYPVVRKGELRFDAWAPCKFDFKSMFPDFTVYLKPGDLKRVSSTRVRIRSKNESDRSNKEEVFFAHALVSSAAIGNVRVKYLSKSITASIRKLETERLRLKQAAKA